MALHTPDLQATLNRLVRPVLRMGGRRWPAFQACGEFGFALALPLSLALVMRRGLSAGMMLFLALAAVATFFALALATKVLTGRENLVYYYHEIAVLGVSVLLLRLLRQPVLPYLDATVLGVGVFLACGRVGCLMAGCCYGRPHTWGVCYTPQHARTGFPSYLVGVRLFPIQALEALWVAGVVTVGSLLVWRGAPPGAGLAWYGTAYGLGRFVFEFLRGDPARPYYAGLSEAQWISFFQLFVLGACERLGWLPVQPWHLAATLLLGGVALALVALRRTPILARQRLLHPRHISEIAEILDRMGEKMGKNGDPWRFHPSTLKPAASDVWSANTGKNLRISGSALQNGSYHYAVSRLDQPLSQAEAGDLAHLIIQLRHPGWDYAMRPGSPGVYHLQVTPPGTTGGRFSEAVS